MCCDNFLIGGNKESIYIGSLSARQKSFRADNGPICTFNHSALQTKTDTCANSVDPDYASRLIRIYIVCHSVFWLLTENHICIGTQVQIQKMKESVVRDERDFSRMLLVAGLLLVILTFTRYWYFSRQCGQPPSCYVGTCYLAAEERADSEGVRDSVEPLFDSKFHFHETFWINLGYRILP